MESMRINRYLAACGLGSRRSVEALIKGGRVDIEGYPCRDLSTVVQPGDKVFVDGEPAVLPSITTWLMLNKPPGTLCSRHDPQGRTLIYHVLPKSARRLHYVGRLDFQSRGLVLLTDAGKTTHALLHPSYEVERTYEVTLREPISPSDMEALRHGVVLENGEVTGKAVVKGISPKKEPMTRLAITLTEGKNREVRRMLAAIGHTVIDLQRVAFGGLSLGDLPEGSHRALTSDEISLLESLPRLSPRSNQRTDT